MDTAPLRLLVVYGSVRSARQGIRAARFIVSACRARGHDVTLVDPLEHPLPLLDRMYKEYPKGQAPAVLEGLAALIVPADAVVVVSGEYNHSVPPALANLLDHFLEE
jgi:NAD(P)H-dependent FMN reductase